MDNRITRKNYAVMSAFMLAGSLISVSAEETYAPLSSLTNTTPLQQETRGVLRAIDQATLSSELAAQVTQMPFREGQKFKKGDLLVRFDCGIYQAQLAASQAAADAAQAELTHNEQLAQLKSVGRHAVSLSSAHLAEAEAESRVYQIQVNHCRINAPFSGQVVNRLVHTHESVAPGTPLLEIVNNQQLEIHLLVPSSWSTRLKPGQEFRFTPDETAQPIKAKILRLGALIDEGSQTLSLIAEITEKDSRLLAGMSGTAQFMETP